MSNQIYEKFEITADEGKFIFHEGDVGDKMYIIREGNIKISKTVDGKEITLAVLSKGDFFGEMALVNKVSRTANASATCTTILLALNRESFMQLVQQNAKIALSIIVKLCKRIQHTNMQLQHIIQKDKQGILALNLYYLFKQHAKEKTPANLLTIIRDFSLNLELTQDAVMNHLKKFQELDIIAISGNTIILKDEKKLFKIANS